MGGQIQHIKVIQTGWPEGINLLHIFKRLKFRSKMEKKLSPRFLTLDRSQTVINILYYQIKISVTLPFTVQYLR